MNLLPVVAMLGTVVLCSVSLHAIAQTPPSAVEMGAYKGLHAAVVRGDQYEVQDLIKSGIDLNSRDSHGRTPLMVATYQKNIEIAGLLLAKGADVNALDYQRYDMLTNAAVMNHLPLVKLAIESGADAKLITSPYDGTALIAAAHLGHAEVVQLLIVAGAPLNHVNNLNWTALIEAIVLGNGGANHQKVVRNLVDAGADLNLSDGNSVRPLSLARRSGYTEIAKILEAANAKP